MEDKYVDLYAKKVFRYMYEAFVTCYVPNNKFLTRRNIIKFFKAKQKTLTDMDNESALNSAFHQAKQWSFEDIKQFNNVVKNKD